MTDTIWHTGRCASFPLVQAHRLYRPSLTQVSLHADTCCGHMCVALQFTELPADEEAASGDISQPSGKSPV